jgi:tetratricopeptide (TPR) repeat protein
MDSSRLIAFFAAALLVVMGPACSAGSTEIKADCAAAAGGNISHAQINVVCGIPPEMYERLVRERGRDTEELNKLRQALALNEAQINNALMILGERNLPRDQIATKLVEMAVEYAQLRRQIQAVPGNDPRVMGLTAAADRALDEGDLEHARELVAVATGQVHAVGLIDRGKPEQAVDELREGERRLYNLLAKAPNDVRLILQQGYIHKTFAQAFSAQGDTARANRYLDLALSTFRRVKDEVSTKERHELAGALNGIGNVQYANGDYRAAIGSYQAATNLVPNYAYAWHDMFLAYRGLAKQGIRDLEAMRWVLAKVRETGAGLLDPNTIRAFESDLTSLEQQTGPQFLSRRSPLLTTA